MDAGLDEESARLLATLIACVVAAALNYSIEKIAYKRLRSSPHTVLNKPDSGASLGAGRLYRRLRW